MEYFRDNWMGLVPAIIMVSIGGVQMGMGGYLMSNLDNEDSATTIVTGKDGKLYKGQRVLRGQMLLSVISGAILTGLGLALLGFHLVRWRRGGGVVAAVVSSKTKTVEHQKKK